jgi:hypothetical protein
VAIEKEIPSVVLGEVDEVPPFPEEEIELEVEDEDGVLIDLEPQIESPQTNFEDNLAEVLPDDSLSKLASELIGYFEEDKESRSEWYTAFAKGLDLLGIKQEERTEPFEGASGVNHPLLSEAVTQFQSQAYKELLPPGGPVSTQVVGDDNSEVMQQSRRVKEFMNYQITHVMEEYDPEMDQLLFYLPLSGSAFKKVYFDTMLDRTVSRFVKAEDFVVSYATTDLSNSPRYTHVMTMTENDLRKMQLNGMYLDMELTGASIPTENQVQEKIDRIEGVKPNYADNNDLYTVLEMHVDLKLTEIEDHGFACPYIVTICQDTNKILSIRRNWQPSDPLYNKVDYFVQYKFLPGLGFYGFGLIHMIGGLTKSVTSILRQLIDAGTLANLPAGFKARGMRIQGENEPLQPGEFRDVDVAGSTIRDALMPLPYKEPSNVLAQLLGVLVDSGRRFASITDMQMGDLGNQEVPVGTTVAMLERGTKVMSAIHKRLHFAQKKEFKLLASLYSRYLPPQYPYALPGGQGYVMAQDFDERVDVIPVSDPNIFSMAQRVLVAQQLLQMAQAAPDIHNLPEAYRRMYDALEIKNVETLFQQQQQVPPRDPISEEQAAMLGQPIQAFDWQDHEAYIAAHSAFIQNPMVQDNPLAVQTISANIQEHQAMLYKQQVEQVMGQPLPPLEQMTPEMMNQIAFAAAQATAEVTGRAKALQEAVELQRIDPVIEVQREEIAQRAQKDATQAQLDAEKIISTEAIAEMKIAADREKTLIQAQQEADRTFAETLKQVREADTKSRGD